MKHIAVFILMLAVVMLSAVVNITPGYAAELAEDQGFTEIYNRVGPSVVSINVVQTSNDTGMPQGGGSGSGFVIDQQGHIVTNNHVVDGASSIEVAFFDGTLARASIIGLDPFSDLAVLKVDDVPSGTLIPTTWGDSDSLMIGQTALAIGSPFGQRWTLTSGIVSGLDRTIQGLTDFSIGGVIQTDAPINPGNSGGPLLDLEGHVIGVNSQIISRSGSNSGIGFAVPSNLVQRVANDLIEKGYADYSYIGISGGDVTLDLIEALELPANLRGVVVSDVLAGGPAARAGLQTPVTNSNGSSFEIPEQLDIITAIDGQPLTGINDLISYLARNTSPGQSVTLDVLRDGSENINLEVVLIPRSRS